MGRLYFGTLIYKGQNRLDFERLSFELISNVLEIKRVALPIHTDHITDNIQIWEFQINHRKLN